MIRDRINREVEIGNKNKSMARVILVSAIIVLLLGSTFFNMQKLTGFFKARTQRYLKDINSKYKNFLYEDDYLLMNPGRLIKEIVLEIEGILGRKFNTINEIDNYLKRNIFMEDSYYLNRGFKR